MPDLVNSRERMLYAFVVMVSLVTYGVTGLVVLAQPEFAISVAFYGVLFAVAACFAQGHAIGRLRGNAIRAGERQFPLLHRTVQDHARRLGLARAPEIYVVESSGLLNAFATRFLGRPGRRVPGPLEVVPQGSRNGTRSLSRVSRRKSPAQSSSATYTGKSVWVSSGLSIRAWVAIAPPR